MSGVYIQKNHLVYNIQKWQSILIYNLLFSLTQKTSHLKLIAMLITFNLIDLFFKTIHVFKSKSASLFDSLFDKGPLNTGITKCFLIDKQVSLHAKFRVHSLVVQLHMAPLEITHFISTHGFFSGELNFITPKYNTILSMGCSNSCFEFLFPECSPMHSRTLWTNPFLLLLKSVILAIGQWVLETLFWYTTTISLILKFLFLPSHIWSSCKDCRYSFFQQDQNLLAICWIQFVWFSTIYIRFEKHFWQWWNYLWFHG